jgi:hypothetical protein
MMRWLGGIGLCLLLSSLGCAGKADPTIKAAAEQVVKAGGSFVPHGATVPVKTADKIPTTAFTIRLVTLNGLKVRDDMAEHLKNLPQLEELHLEDSYFTDKGLEQLQSLKRLQTLDLHKSIYISDKGLTSLQGMTNLQKLELSYTRITDAGIDALLALKQLKTLHVTGTRITPDGVTKLKDGLKKCEILK